MASGWGTGGWSNARGNAQPPNPFTAGQTQAISDAFTWNAPTLMQNDITASRLAGQLGYGDAQYQLGVDQLQQNTALDRARLGLAGKDIGVDRDSIMRQMGVEDQLHALAGQLFGVDRRGLDLNQSGINSQLNTQNRLHDRARYQELSDKTVKGSVGSVMNRRNNAEITASQHDSWDKFWRDTAGTNLEREKVGIAESQAGIQSKETKAKLADRLKVLDTESAKLGIDRKQLEANLSQGLARLGVDRMFGMNDILDAMLSNDIDRQAIAQQIFREAMNMSQLHEPGGLGSVGVPTPRQPDPSSQTPAAQQTAIDQFMNTMRTGGIR